MLTGNSFIMTMRGVEELNDEDIPIYIIVAIGLSRISREIMMLLYIMKMRMMHTIRLLL